MLEFVVSVVWNAALDGAASLMLAMPGHRGCCRPPSWSAFVGQRWGTFDVAPWNLFNMWWRAGQWAVQRSDGSTHMD